LTRTSRIAVVGEHLNEVVRAAAAI